MAGRRGVAHTSDMVTIIYPQGCREVRILTFFVVFLEFPEVYLVIRISSNNLCLEVI